MSSLSVLSHTAQEKSNERLEEVIHNLNKDLILKILNYMIIGFFFLSSIMLIIVLFYSNTNADKIDDPVQTLDHHRTNVYWLYDGYWNV